MHRSFPNVDDPSSVDELASERGYKNRDTICVSPATMGDAYESKVKMFFNEHLHEDEEIRYILDGAGYFDVRSEGDEWVRLRLEKGDLIVLPSGIYHRFTSDEQNVFHNPGCSGEQSQLMSVTVHKSHETVQRRAEMDAIESWYGHG